MDTTLIAFAAATLIIGLVCGLAPIFSGIKDDQNRLKQLTGIAAGIIIASAMLVVIPEGYELAMTDEHGTDDALAGSVALVILEVDHGDINATEGIEEIEALIGGHGDGHEDEHGHDEEEDGHDDHGHDSEASLSDSIGAVIEEVEDGDINATTGIEEIEELISTHGHEEESHDDHASGLLMGGAIMAGFLLMFVLEGSGIGHAVHEEHHDHEHGHGHGHVHHAAAGGLLVFGLTLHAATDGVAIGAAAATGDFALTVTVLLAVLIHKGPAAFSLGVFSAHEREDRKDSIRDVVIFSLATPVMIIIAGLALAELETHMIGLAMLFSAGTFLYVATVDTLPDIHNPETGKKAMIHVLIGVAILVVLLLIANTLDIGHAH
ncbi:MAG TPA: ZIP family metal transporter [Candidatus Thalassarchaeaceae archaeon]|jgi:zinc transporter 9|nr:ZIP family metal transporter [Candidatus Thalassarchaeaceae archaeon]HJM41079.1 ZIP family metal transporter [Candidatus Thalassarchaeaceae archaeon]